MDQIMDFHCMPSTMRPSNSSQTLWVAIPLSTKKQTAWTAQISPKFLVGLQRSPHALYWYLSNKCGCEGSANQTGFEFFQIFTQNVYWRAVIPCLQLVWTNLATVVFSSFATKTTIFHNHHSLSKIWGPSVSQGGGESNGILRLDTDDSWFLSLWSVIRLVKLI